MALALAGVILTAYSGDNDVVVAFSAPPPCRPTPIAPVGSRTIRTRLEYTHSPDDVGNSTIFEATSYLNSLGAAADTANDGAGLMKSLRDQQGQRRHERQRAQQEATYRAMRRTSPTEAFHARIAEEEARRQEKDRDRLKLLYVKRKERLEAKKRRERRAPAADEGEEGRGAEKDETVALERGKRGVPILDRPFADAPPLLIGCTVTLQYSALTPFQKRAVDVARGYHQEHREQMTQACRDDDGGEVDNPPSPLSSIQAAPLIAVVDNYTGAASAPPSLQQQPRKAKRYATLASIKIAESAGNDEPAIELTGVGRVLLYDYFFSEEAGMTKDEEDLARIRARIREFDEGEAQVEMADDADDADGALPVVMAEFDLLLDDASVLSSDPSNGGEGSTIEHPTSSVHAFADLHRTANKVYRLHEERKKLAAGLRAAEARLRLGTGAAVAAAVQENCLVEFEDCDGLGRLLGGAHGSVSEAPAKERGAAASTGSSDDRAPRDAPHSRLEALENFGLNAEVALATLPDLAAQLTVRLVPFYSPAHRAREEYEVEVASLAVWKALEAYASPEEVAEALAEVPSSARQRLERGYEVMLRHRDELRALVERVSRELIECGEECTDL